MASIPLHIPGEQAGLAFEEYADPTGNGQATRSISWFAADGSVVARSGIYMVKHADGQIKLVYGNTGHDSGEIFELDGDNRPTVQAL